MQKALTLLACLLLAATLSAQNSKKADQAFKEGDYSRAIDEYTTLWELTDDPQTKATYKFRIGESYRKLNRPDRAEKPLLEAIKGSYMSSEVYFSLGEVQLKLGKYDDALAAFEAYKRATPGDALADTRIASCKFAKANEQVNTLFDLKLLDRINSRRNEFGVSYFNNGIMFASTRVTDTPSNSKKKSDEEEEEENSNKGDEVYTRTGWGKAKLFTASGDNGSFNRPVEITELNNMKNFSDDGVFAYDPYSRQGYFARRDGKKACIQFMELQNGKWEKGDKIEIDSKGEPIGHPFVTPDGSRIYFTSTMPGGYGKSDIWYITRSGKSWSAPVNAGDKINTPGNEVYPTIAGDYLFFSSDGQIGFGGLDIFAAKLIDGTPQQPLNLGHPFNSYADDYNIAIRSDMEEGVLVSGRHDKWGDDLFYFKGFPSALLASGSVTDFDSGKPISNVTLELVQKSNNKTVNKIVSNSDGQFSIFVAPEQQYTVKASVAGYAPASKEFVTGAERFGKVGDFNFDFRLAANASVISGRIYDRRTMIALENETINLIANGNIVQTVKTDFDGVYKFGNIKENTKYIIKVSPVKRYFTDSKEQNVTSLARNTMFGNNDLALEKIDIGKEILMDKVYFPYGKTNLLSESFKELDRLARLFAQNPQCKILITSHTDIRPTVKASQELTIARAEAVRDYLFSKGVSTNHLSIKGAGKTTLLIRNAKTEEEHIANNRITYTVVRVEEVAEPVEYSSTYKPATTQQPVTTTTTTAPVTTNNNAQPATTKPATTTPATTTPATTTKPATTAPAVSNNDSGDYASLPWRVQVAALKALNMENPTFKNIKSELKMDVRYDLGADGIYRYYIGGFKTKEDAMAAMQKLKSIKIDGVLKPKW